MTILSREVLFKAFADLKRQEQVMVRTHALRISAYMLIYSRPVWEWLFSLAYGRFQRQLVMGQRSWNAWEYRGRSFHVTTKFGKSRKFDEQVSKVESIKNLLKRSGYYGKVEGRSGPDFKAEGLLAYEQRPGKKLKQIVSTLIVGLTPGQWDEATSDKHLNLLVEARWRLEQDPTRDSLAFAENAMQAAWRGMLLHKKCYLAPPLEWVLAAEGKRRVRAPSKKMADVPERFEALKRRMKQTANDDVFASLRRP